MVLFQKSFSKSYKLFPHHFSETEKTKDCLETRLYIDWLSLCRGRDNVQTMVFVPKTFLEQATIASPS